MSDDVFMLCIRIEEKGMKGIMTVHESPVMVLITTIKFDFRSQKSSKHVLYSCTTGTHFGISPTGL